MKSTFEKMGGTYTLGAGGLFRIPHFRNFVAGKYALHVLLL